MVYLKMVCQKPYKMAILAILWWFLGRSDIPLGCPNPGYLPVSWLQTALPRIEMVGNHLYPIDGGQTGQKLCFWPVLPSVSHANPCGVGGDLPGTMFREWSFFVVKPWNPYWVSWFTWKRLSKTSKKWSFLTIFRRFWDGSHGSFTIHENGSLRLPYTALLNLRDYEDLESNGCLRHPCKTMIIDQSHVFFYQKYMTLVNNHGFTSDSKAKGLRIA